MRRLLVLASVLLLLGACRTVPIYNVENAEIFTGSGKDLSHAQVRTAIVNGLVAKSWQMKEIDSSTIEATNGSKGRTATVRIKYSNKNYSINYVNSANIRHNGGNIHGRYNKWIRSLQDKINALLVTM